MALDWVTLIAGAVGGGFLTDYIGRTGDRRTARADLLGAQRKLAAARRGEDSAAVEEAAHEVLRLGIIAGVPQWLNRRYRDTAVAESRARARVEPIARQTISDEVGELEAISHQWAITATDIGSWVLVMDEHRATGFMFEYAVWHPWRARVLSVRWRRQAAKREGYRMWLATDGPGE